jgi:anti-sigma B factor antagonist
MLLQIEERHIPPDITLIELVGKLTLGRESQRVEALVEEISGPWRLKAIFDMTRVDYLDSTGIGLLALAAGKLKAAGGRLVVVAGEGRVLQLLKMTQVALIFPVYTTMEQAECAFAETQPRAAALRRDM